MNPHGTAFCTDARMFVCLSSTLFVTAPYKYDENHGRKRDHEDRQMPSVGDPRTSAFRCQPHVAHEAPPCVPGCPRVRIPWAARVRIRTRLLRFCSRRMMRLQPRSPLWATCSFAIADKRTGSDMGVRSAWCGLVQARQETCSLATDLGATRAPTSMPGGWGPRLLCPCSPLPMSSHPDPCASDQGNGEEH